jgi:hypothetical protein
MQYIGFALLGNPYMCVGRNVLYDATLLKSKKWTTEELSITSGDDDLTIQTLATKENTTVCLSRDSYTISEPKKSWKNFSNQKLRHYESGSLYKLSNRLLLGFYLFSKLLLYVSFVFLLMLSNYDIQLLEGIFILYAIATTLLNFNLNYSLQVNKRWYFSFLNDFIYCIFTVTLGLISLLKPTKSWK